MRNEFTTHEVKGRKFLKIRLKTPPPKVMKDEKKYSRKPKHRERIEW